MGIKISSLPNNSLPYTGSEEIPLTQNGQTRAGTLSSFVNYLSGGLNVANYAVKNANNNFGTAQTIAGGLEVVGDIVGSTFKLVNDVTFRPPGDNSASVVSINHYNDIGVSISSEYSVAIGTGSADSSTLYGVAAIGADAMKNSTLPNNTVAVGFGAGKSSEYSTRCIFIGANAGEQSGAGGNISNNIAIGQSANRFAGQSNTVLSYASEIIAIGSNAGEYAGYDGNVTSVVAIGVDAGRDVGNTGTATNIVAVGNSAGFGVGLAGTAGNVVAVGNNAGKNAGYLGTATNIVAIGKEAGYRSGYQTTSENNIFIGLSSGYNKQGSRNTFVGDLTNTSPTSATGLSGCIAIGYGAEPTARNTIAIGSASTPLSVVPGGTIGSSLSGLKIMINGKYFTIPLLA